MNTKTSTPTTPDEPKATKDHRARVSLVIDAYEWIIQLYAKARRVEKCRELAAKMMAKAKENPEDFGRWKSVIVQVSSPPETAKA